jgi:hypothetical protein
MYGLKPVPFKDGTLLFLDCGGPSSQLSLFTSEGWGLRSMVTLNVLARDLGSLNRPRPSTRPWPRTPIALTVKTIPFSDGLFGSLRYNDFLRIIGAES